MLRAYAYAKVNLYLSVVGRRSDGYHEIETVFQSVDLADELFFEASEHVEVVCSLPALSGPGNLAQVAAEQLRAAAGVTSGARITIDKRIPIAAGLAGGSANAAATLVGLNSLWRLGLGEDALRSIGSRIGADVPFCVMGGTAFGAGSGTALSKMPPFGHGPIVLAKASGQLLAADVYAAYDKNPAQPKRSVAALRAFLDVQGEGDVCPMLENALEPAVVRLLPGVGRIRDAALAAGAHCALVSGSGPTVFAVCGSEAEADGVAAAVRGLCEFVHVCAPIDQGVQLLRE